jgi:hypothetical protein
MIFLHKLFRKTDNVDSEEMRAKIRFPSRRISPVIDRISLWTYLVERNSQPLPGPASMDEDATSKTKPNAGWLIEYHLHYYGIDPVERHHPWRSRDGGYCFWSTARLSSIGLFERLLAYARLEGWVRNPSKYLLAVGADLPEEWASIIDEIVLCEE